MSSKLDIYNMVAVHLGENIISSLTSTAKIVSLINAVYANVRDDLLRDHPWNFALVREELVADDTPIFGYDYSFLIPPQCLRVVEISVDDSPYVIEGTVILTDESELSLRYVSRITDETLFDVKFTHALGALLAAKICYNLTGSHQREVSLYELAKSYLPATKAIGGIEEPVTDDWSWEASRL